MLAKKLLFFVIWNDLEGAVRQAGGILIGHDVGYDLDGNLTGDFDWDYVYDANNRLVKMTNKDL
ncbi:RHS repeat protein, partial [Puniceicoccaceae bacterium K14]|nr:RHS repeat protein [Puniceicoccaceae bacterium K14]